ncbi:DUF397 domain-containing protein [Streptomyces sp. NBC_00076]|uniref:DUF397 domain-containing protein n=1 Tax=Streptomyces sp. NBC_00076 TaxID=2975642 RepID=UPI0032435EA8
MSTAAQAARQPAWFKSSYSGGNATECAETAFVSSSVLVRDSKWPGGASLTFSAEAWGGFISRVGNYFPLNFRKES